MYIFDIEHNKLLHKLEGGKTFFMGFRKPSLGHLLFVVDDVVSCLFCNATQPTRSRFAPSSSPLILRGC